jgi:hypothetical protein
LFGLRSNTDEVCISPMKGPRACALFAGVALIAGSRPVHAQPWSCYTIQPGDTAASLAQRVGGHAAHRHQLWFQIFDPAASRFIAKARYDRIRPGWLACVSAASGADRTSTAAVAIGRPPPASSGITQTLEGIQLDPRWYFVMLLVTAPFVWYIADRRWKGRRAVIDDMTRFAESFIREFERPLVLPHLASPAVRFRVRFKPQRGRLEVLLAPGAGRSYPNLSDHRKNVEYDLERVLHELHDRPFVSDSPRQRGQWVIVPFHLEVHEKQEGVT